MISTGGTPLDNINPNATYSEQFTWNDTNGDLVFQNGEQTGAPVTTSGISTVIDPGFKRPYTDEFTAGLDRELMPGLGFNVTYTYRREKDQIATYNPNQPFATTLTTRADLGPDGVAGTGDDSTFQFYDRISPVNLTAVTNDPTLVQSYSGVEFTLDKRMSNRWQGLISYTLSRARFEDPSVNINPNSLLNASGRLADQTAVGTVMLSRQVGDRPHNFKLTGSYLLPWGEVLIGANFLAQSGAPVTRYVNTPLTVGGTTNVMVEEAGAHRLPTRAVLDLRVQKSIVFGARSLDFAMDVSNLFNSNVTWDARNLSGTINALPGGIPGGPVNVLPQFLSPAAVLGPRNMRFSAAFRFSQSTRTIRSRRRHSGAGAGCFASPTFKGRGIVTSAPYAAARSEELDDAHEFRTTRVSEVPRRGLRRRRRPGRRPAGPDRPRPGADAVPARRLRHAASTFLSFGPIAPTDRDDLVLPAGFRYLTVLAYGDRFTSSGERFGFNADFTAFIPRNADGTEGLLWREPRVRRHAPPTTTARRSPPSSAACPPCEDMKFDVGGSVVDIYLSSGGNWYVTPNSALNRRITADSLVIADGPALQGVSNVGGTLGNCSGCHTPWNTVLTCEENYQDYVPENLVDRRPGHGRRRLQQERHPLRLGGRDRSARSAVDSGEAHVARPVPPRERRRCGPPPTRPVIAYMGDDRTNGHVYKFVSAGRYMPGSAANKQLLVERPAVLGALQRRRQRPVDRAGAGHRAQPVSRAQCADGADRRDHARRGLRRLAGQHPDRRLPGQQPGRRDAHRAARGRRGAPGGQERVHRLHRQRHRAEQPVHQHLRRAGPHRRGQRRRPRARPSPGSAGRPAARTTRRRPATSSRRPTTCRSTRPPTCGSSPTSRRRT